jgi:hypothetical protein
MENNMSSTEIFDEACRIQAKHFSPNSQHSRDCNSALFEAVVQASYNDQHKSLLDKDISIPKTHLVKTGTGTGKTTFCICLIAALVRALDSYSVCYVVATVKEAQEVYNQLQSLIPDDTLAIYTSEHSSIEACERSTASVFKHVQKHGTSNQKSLKQARVAICTHEHWLSEGERKIDLGARYWQGRHRNIVIVDEFPASTITEEISPSDLDQLADELERIPEYQTQAELVRSTANSFRHKCSINGHQFEVAGLISSKQQTSLQCIDLDCISDNRNIESLRLALKALLATGRNQAFLHRTGSTKTSGIKGQKKLVAYNDRFKPHPGLIILDATAELDPHLQSEGDFITHKGPDVDYRNLHIEHLQQPQEFTQISSRNANRAMVASYARWIKRIVKENTQPEEQIFIVVPKKVKEQMNESNPIPGRNVLTATWGMGIGSNSYRECTSAFLFSEFHLPKLSYLSQVLATSHDAQLQQTIACANGGKSTGTVKKRASAHRLRQFKQMASRGCIRNVDENGTAKPMKLYTTMGPDLLFANYDKVFPGAPRPKSSMVALDDLNTKPKKLAAILRGRAEAEEPIELLGSDLQRLAGIAPKELKRIFRSKQCRAEAGSGWEFISGNGRKASPKLKYTPNAATMKGDQCLIN